MRANVPTAQVQASEIDWSYFVRFDFPGVTGTKRFTDRYLGDYTGNIDGAGSLVWTYSGFDVGPLDNASNNPTSVSWLKFWNLDSPPTWTTLANSPGLRNVPVQVWVAWFDTSTGALVNSYVVYKGTVDDHVISASAQLTIKPGVTPWARMLPAQIIGNLCLYKYRDAATCQYIGAEPGAELSCNKTRADCVLRTNQARFGGADLTPKPGERIAWGDNSSQY